MIQSTVQPTRPLRPHTPPKFSSIYPHQTGGSTYCALAALDLLPDDASSSLSLQTEAALTPKQRAQTVRWLLYHQKSGFAGRTNKESDACYCFWCGASLAVRTHWRCGNGSIFLRVQILGHGQLANTTANADFLLQCQFKFGGIRKDPESPPGTFLQFQNTSS